MRKRFFPAFTYFLKTYFTLLPEIMYKFTLGILLNPRETQKLIHQILNNKDLSITDKIIGSIEPSELFGNTKMDIKLEGKYYLPKSSETRNLKELASLAYLVRMINPKSIFEFGTFVGRTTSLLALSSEEDCVIYTIDLPSNEVSHNIGEEYSNKPFSSRIVQYNLNSRKFDFDNFKEKIDFVWVDACHDYDFVKSDSENALKICKPGGIIAWHDYRPSAWWSGVTKYIRELHNKYPEIKHIKGTTISFLKKNGTYE